MFTGSYEPYEIGNSRVFPQATAPPRCHRGVSQKALSEGSLRDCADSDLLTLLQVAVMRFERPLMRVQADNGDETPSPAGMELGVCNLHHIPTGGLRVVDPPSTLADATPQAAPDDDDVVDRLLNTARTKIWRPIIPKT
jgi:hypothetical protein